MQIIVILALIVGPPCEDKKHDVYLLIDSKDKNVKSYEIVSKSRVILAELGRRDWEPELEFIIQNRANIIIEEFEEKRFNIKPKMPAFKFSKYQDYKEFCPGTFSSSGSFLRSLSCLIRWEDYIVEMNEWKMDKSGFQFYRKFDGDNLMMWNAQPPNHPEIFPRQINDYKAFNFYKYIERFKAYDTENVDINTEDGQGTIFWLEYSQSNFWYTGIKD
jgi:hypothetical protein